MLSYIAILSFIVCVWSLSPLSVSAAGAKLATRTPIKSPTYGGRGGDPFDDVAAFNEPGSSPIVGIRAINVSYGSYLNSIQVVYMLANQSLYQAPPRGRPSNQIFVINLDSDEHITLIEGMADGVVIDYLTITTTGPEQVKKVYGPFGKPGLQTPFTMPGHIVGFHGRAGNVINNIGVYALEEIKKSKSFGNGPTGGSLFFSDEVGIKVPPVVRLSSLAVWYGDYVDGIQAEYLLLGGSKLLGERHGGQSASTFTNITLRDEETIEEVKVGTSDFNQIISMLTFTARKADGSKEIYGPYGKGSDKTDSFNGTIFGFYGLSGTYLKKFGFYYI